MSDHNHEYRDVTKPISKQGSKEHDAVIKIGSGSWIGKNAVIIGNVSIGEHCVIGANSVVNTNLPDFCVAVGCPAKIVKKYDFETAGWKTFKY